MSILYVGCSAKQHHDFLFRTREEPNKVRMQRIEMGTQVAIHKDDTESSLMYIVNQHQKYGLIPMSEIDRTKPFIGLVYSIDKPIPMEKIMYASEHNDGVLEEQGRDVRRIQAASLFSGINGRGDVQLNNLELETVEQNKETDRGLNEVIEVPAQTGEAQTSRNGRDKRRGRR